MKKKNIIIIIMLIIAIIGLIVIASLFTRIYKGYKLYGNEYCDNDLNSHVRFGGDIVVTYKCDICNIENEYGSTATPKICPFCAELTGRCSTCGKLLEKNIIGNCETKF